MKPGTFEATNYGLPLSETAEPSSYAHLSLDHDRDELRSAMLRHGGFAGQELTPEMLEKMEQRIDAVLAARIKSER